MKNKHLYWTLTAIWAAYLFFLSGASLFIAYLFEGEPDIWSLSLFRISPAIFLLNIFLVGVSSFHYLTISHVLTLIFFTLSLITLGFWIYFYGFHSFELEDIALINSLGIVFHLTITNTTLKHLHRKRKELGLRPII